jgi:hypothetical protein
MLRVRLTGFATFRKSYGIIYNTSYSKRTLLGGGVIAFFRMIRSSFPLTKNVFGTSWYLPCIGHNKPYCQLLFQPLTYVEVRTLDRYNLPLRHMQACLQEQVYNEIKRVGL